MATTNHGITVPTVGASTDTWGTEGNLCWTTLDGRMPSLTGLKIDGTTSLPFSGAQAFAVGSAAAPGIWFTGDSNSGLYWIGADSVGISLGGTLRTTFATTGITSTGGFSGTTGTFSGAVSTGALTPTTLAPTGLTSIAASATGGAKLNLAPGVSPTSPNNGDLWSTATEFNVRIGGTTHNLLSSGGNWTTARSITFATGDVTGTTGTFDGSANVSNVALTIANDSVSMAKLANIATSTVIGRVAASTGDPKALSAAELSGLVDLSSATVGTGSGAAGYVKIGPIYLQWGAVSVTASNVAGTTGEGLVTFPATFPTAVSSVVATAIQPSGAEGSSNTQNAYINDLTTSGCAIGLDSNGGTPTFTVSWIAIGY